MEQDSRTLTAEKAIEFLGTEVELDAESGQLKKKRLIEVRKSLDFYANWSLDLFVSFKRFRDGRKTLNEAELFLLPDELPIFTQALIEHPILLPNSYSQNLSMERSIYCIRLTSEEPFEDFAERLTAALRVLELK